MDERNRPRRHIVAQSSECPRFPGLQLCSALAGRIRTDDKRGGSIGQRVLGSPSGERTATVIASGVIVTRPDILIRLDFHNATFPGLFRCCSTLHRWRFQRVKASSVGVSPCESVPALISDTPAGRKRSAAGLEVGIRSVSFHCGERTTFQIVTNCYILAVSLPRSLEPPTADRPSVRPGRNDPPADLPVPAPSSRPGRS